MDNIFECLKNDGRGYNKLTEMSQIKLQMFTLFLSIATHRFDWKGLPKELPSWCLEKVVNLYGQGVLFKVGDKYVVTQAVTSSMIDIYGEPYQVQPVAMNGISFPVINVKDCVVNTDGNAEVIKQDGVLIKNNMYSIPTYVMIKPFVEKLCYIWESAGINAGLSRIVALIHCNKDLSGVVKAEVGKILGNKNGLVVVNEKTNVLETIEKVDLQVPYTPSDYWLDFDNTFNKICEIIGITTDMNKAKKERVLVAQVESNDELTTIVEDTYIEFRKIACEQAKELWGLAIEVNNKCEEVKATTPMDNKGMGFDDNQDKELTDK